jgi:cytochrome c peroxidase
MKKVIFSVSFLATFVVVLIACKKDTKTDNPTEEPVKHDSTLYSFNSGSFPAPNLAGDNALTEQGVQLGRMLFYEKTLSKNNMISCASCHKQEFAFDDTARFSIGVLGLKGKRQAMAIFNTAWHTNEFFWDGRAHLLRDQSLLPIQDTLEMFETLPSIINKLSNNPIYKVQFTKAFGSGEVTSEKVSKALEQFMNSIVSNDSKYDKYLAGSATLTPSEENGRKLFFQEYNQFFPAQSGAECAHCHSGFNFTNNDYMNNGMDTDASITDIGREKVTNDIADKAKFKVPSLRNIAITAPYMHDGRFKTLEEVVDHYNNGLKPSSYIDPALENTRGTGLMLSAQQKVDLVNFLKTLTDNSLVNNPKYKSPF